MPKTPKSSKASPAKSDAGEKRRVFNFLRSPLRKSSQKTAPVETTYPAADAEANVPPEGSESEFLTADPPSSPKAPDQLEALATAKEIYVDPSPEVNPDVPGDTESEAGLSYVTGPISSDSESGADSESIADSASFEFEKDTEDTIASVDEDEDAVPEPAVFSEILVQSEPIAVEQSDIGDLEASTMDATEDDGLSTNAATRNYVFAHFMVGNTYPYTVDDWYADIKLAASRGIDGFVLNVGREDWQKQRCIDCFAAAKRLPESTFFKFFISFDMTSVYGNSTGDVQLFRDYLNVLYKSARMFRHPRTNGVVVSTFSGENSYFGQGSLEGGWQYLKNELNKIVPIYFIPSFFISPARYHNISAMDGAFNWNGGWPVELNPSTDRSQVVNAKLDSDYYHLENLTGGRTFMAAVSPWFFTHYGPNTWNKNWIYRGDDWLFVRRWEQLISMRDKIDIAQVISWNDYGESHYIGPIKGAQPNSQAWVDGFPHEAWLTLNQYYAKAFQTGKYPTIEQERIFIWARPHPKDATAPDSVPRPDNWQLTDDTAWVVVFANRPGVVSLYTKDDGSDRTTHQVNAGVTKLSFPLKVGQGMRASLCRDNRVYVVCNPTNYTFNGQPPVYNFNAYVAMSS